MADPYIPVDTSGEDYYGNMAIAGTNAADAYSFMPTIDFRASAPTSYASTGSFNAPVQNPFASLASTANSWLPSITSPATPGGMPRTLFMTPADVSTKLSPLLSATQEYSPSEAQKIVESSVLASPTNTAVVSALSDRIKAAGLNPDFLTANTPINAQAAAYTDAMARAAKFSDLYKSGIDAQVSPSTMAGHAAAANTALSGLTSADPNISMASKVALDRIASDFSGQIDANKAVSSQIKSGLSAASIATDPSALISDASTRLSALKNAPGGEMLASKLSGKLAVAQSDWTTANNQDLPLTERNSAAARVQSSLVDLNGTLAEINNFDKAAGRASTDVAKAITEVKSSADVLMSGPAAKVIGPSKLEFDNAVAKYNDPTLSATEKTRQADIVLAAKRNYDQTLMVARNTKTSSMNLFAKNQLGEDMGVNYEAMPMYLALFAAVAGPIQQSMQAKAQREFQLKLYDKQQQDAKDNLQFQYDLQKQYGYDPASQAAAAAEANQPRRAAPAEAQSAPSLNVRRTT